MRYSQIRDLLQAADSIALFAGATLTLEVTAGAPATPGRGSSKKAKMGSSTQKKTNLPAWNTSWSPKNGTAKAKGAAKAKPVRQKDAAKKDGKKDAKKDAKRDAKRDAKKVTVTSKIDTGIKDARKERRRKVVIDKTSRRGIGISVNPYDNKEYGMKIIGIIPDSPADQLGVLRLNDRIVSVNDKDTKGMLFEDIAKLLKVKRAETRHRRLRHCL